VGAVGEAQQRAALALMFGKHAREDNRDTGARSASAASHGDERDHETADKPDSPDDLTKQSWFYVIRKTAREFSDDQCTDLAAALTYYSVLALFPAAIAILSLVGLVGQGPKTVDALLTILRDVGASGAADILGPTLTQLSNTSNSGLALILGLAAALWSASGYVGAFGRGMNRIYEIDEGRPVWKLRPAMLLVTLITVVLTALVALGLVLTGPAAQAVGDAVGLGSTVVTVWSIAKWPIMLAVVILIVALLYYATPNVKQPKFRWISIGAVVAIVTWMLASAAFGLYVANFASYDKTYGSLAGVIVFLLWLWITNLALLSGAELDAELERGRELQAGMPAEETIQLPARDTRKSDKAAKKDRADIEAGRRLRHTHGRDRDDDRDPDHDQDQGPDQDPDQDAVIARERSSRGRTS
jgi:membrane protein